MAERYSLGEILQEMGAQNPVLLDVRISFFSGEGKGAVRGAGRGGGDFLLKKFQERPPAGGGGGQGARRVFAGNRHFGTFPCQSS